jgi:cyclophilin family peptidyl-prolyl cis-trans isomerase
MSQLKDLYEKSQKNNLVQARIIPKQAVNFVDQTNEFQKEFTTDRRPGGSTDYTEKALGYYDNERTGMVIPNSFIKQGDPTSAIELNRYSPADGQSYYVPGQPGSFGNNGG